MEYNHQYKLFQAYGVGMITKQELQRIALKKKKDLAFMEKDYALTWVLKAIYSNPILAETLVFKGGTCISKIYAENYRLSEYLDFSLYKNKELSIELLVSELEKSFEKVKTEGAPELSVKTYERLANQGYMSIKIKYLGPLAHAGEIKLEVSLKEFVIYASEYLPLKDKTYQDIGEFKVHCYGINEVVAEKVRAILQRGKSRDYYDVWMLMTSKNFSRIVLMEPQKIINVVEKKCARNNLKFEPELMFEESRLNDAKKYWKDSLGRMTSELPEFERVVKDLEEKFFEVYELYLFSKDLDGEHLDNMNRSPSTQVLLFRAARLLEKKLDSKKKSEVLNAISVLSEILKKKDYSWMILGLIGVFYELQGDRDKDIKEAASNFLKRYQKR